MIDVDLASAAAATLPLLPPLLLLLLLHIAAATIAILLRSGREHRCTTPPPTNGHFVRLSRGLCHYRVDGIGNTGSPTVLLVHGLTGSSGYFVWLARALSQKGRRRVVSLDLYGRGRTSYPADDAPMTAELFAEQIFEFLREMPQGRSDTCRMNGIDCEEDRLPIDLVGYSMGGGVAVAFAAKWPERCRSLTLIAPCGTRNMRLPLSLRLLLRLPLVPELLIWLCFSPKQALLGRKDDQWEDVTEWEGWEEHAREEGRRAVEEATTLRLSMLNTLRHFPLDDLEEEMTMVATRLAPGRLEVPLPQPSLVGGRKSGSGSGTSLVHVIWGGNDEVVPVAGAARLLQRIPGATYDPSRFAKSTHNLPLERAEEVADEMIKWWGGSRGSLSET